MPVYPGGFDYIQELHVTHEENMRLKVENAQLTAKRDTLQ